MLIEGGKLAITTIARKILGNLKKKRDRTFLKKKNKMIVFKKTGSNCTLINTSSENWR